MEGKLRDLCLPPVAAGLAQRAAHVAVLLELARGEVSAAHEAHVFLSFYLRILHHVPRKEMPAKIRSPATKYASSSGAAMTARPTRMQATPAPRSAGPNGGSDGRP